MQHPVPPESSHPTGSFPTDPAGLPAAPQPVVLELADGDTLDLAVGPVAKRLGESTVRMLGYNGSIPGPTLKVRQGSEIAVNVTNDGDLDTTVHWHGLRLENRYDGVPHETQAPIPVGGTLHLPGPVPRPGAVLVPPAHPRGLHPGARPVRQHPGRSQRRRLLATGRP